MLYENINERKKCTEVYAGLATYSRGQPVRLKDVARRQHISEKYLEQIVSAIQKAALGSPKAYPYITDDRKIKK